MNIALAHDYDFIIYAMMPLALAQNCLASIIRADGSPQYAMGAMLVGAVLNIIGDPVAIFLQSICHAKAAVPLSILRDVLLIVFSIVMLRFRGVTGIFWGAPIADVLAIAVTAVVMLHLWTQLKAEDGDTAQDQSVLKSSHPGVIVTIAREHGSAGKRAGQLLAEKLGVPCYYKEMTALSAQESGLAKEFISGINSDENAVMKDLYLSTNVVQQA